MEFHTDFILEKKIADVSIELTDKCNLKCGYCFNESNPSNSTEIHFSKIKSIVDDLATMEELPTISLTGGEVFLRHDWEEIANYVSAKGFQVAFSSNGLLLDKKLIEKLLRINVKSIQISLDGMDNDSNSYRTQTYTETIINNIKLICNTRLHKKLNLRVTISEKNKDYLEPIVKFASENKIGISWGHLQHIGRARIKIKDKLDSENLGRIQGYLQELNKKYNMNYELPALGVGVDICHLISGQKPYAIRIDPKGDVYPCQGASTQPFIIGNVYKQSITSIIYGSVMKELVTLLTLRRKFMIRGNCKKCFYGMQCQGGCPGNSAEANDFFAAPKRMCVAWKSIIARQVAKTIKNT